MGCMIEPDLFDLCSLALARVSLSAIRSCRDPVCVSRSVRQIRYPVGVYQRDQARSRVPRISPARLALLSVDTVSGLYDTSTRIAGGIVVFWAIFLEVKRERLGWRP